jgi:hypothetical protein
MVHKAAIGTTVLLAGVAAFQIALTLGAPWGDISYGGQAETTDGVLPGTYRVMSAVAVLILLCCVCHSGQGRGRVLTVARCHLRSPGDVGYLRLLGPEYRDESDFVSCG